MLLLLEMFFTRFDRHPRVRFALRILFLSLNTTKKEEMNEEAQNIPKTKKKSRVDRLVFTFSWVFCRPKMSKFVGKKIIIINE